MTLAVLDGNRHAAHTLPTELTRRFMTERPLHHVLLTKYNSELPDRHGKKLGLDADWLKKRLDLFCAWTLPSVRRQNSPPDDWLLFTDADTPATALEELRKVVGDTGQIVPVAGPLTDDRIRDFLAVAIPKKCRVLCTTRLDSDDAIASTHLARIQDHSSWRGFLNFRNGYQMCGGRLYRRWDSSGPFLSFVEDVDTSGPPVGVFQVPHHLAATVAPIRQIHGASAWLQVLHRANLANQLQGILASTTRAAKDLGFDPSEGIRDTSSFSISQAVSALSAQIKHEARLAFRRMKLL
jgi:hypothetical protein